MIKIFGLRRSGTNYIAWLLSNNFSRIRINHEYSDEFGHKHSIITPDGVLSEEVRAIIGFCGTKVKIGNEQLIKKRKKCVVCIVKDPYSWYLSVMNMYRKLNHMNAPKEFLNPFPLHPEHILRWNIINKSYITFCKENPTQSILIKYEDLLLDYKTTLITIQNKFNLTKVGSWKNNNCVVDPYYHHNTPFTKTQYYINNIFLNEYDKDNIDWFNRYLDKTVVTTLGYKVHEK